jgi:hypothetical protein
LPPEAISDGGSRRPRGTGQASNVSGKCTQVQARSSPNGNAVDSLTRSIGSRPRSASGTARSARAEASAGTLTVTRSASAVSHSIPMRGVSDGFSRVTSSRPCSPAKAFIVAMLRTTAPTRLRWHRCMAIRPKPASRKVISNAMLLP